MFTGSHIVAFGNVGWYSARTGTDGIACTAAVFGNPLAGTTKVCDYR